MRTKSGPRSGRGGRSVARQNSLKAASQSTSSELETDFHNDVSQQQVPIPTSVRSMRDLCRLMETATEEVREYLTEEFSIMYECKTCYSIFRSLANLISHKRFYCTTRFLNRPRPASRDYVLEQLTQLVIPTEPEVNTEERWHLGEDGQSSVANGQPWSTSIKTSIPPIGQGGSCSKTRDSGDGGSVAPTQKKKPSTEFSVHLEHLTKNAVYQTVSYEGTIGDLMSDQVAEVQGLSVDSQVTLGPDGKILSEQPHENTEAEEKESKSTTDGNVAKNSPNKIAKNELQTTGSQYYVCGICSSTCSTRKTLTYHMQYMHSKYRMCYPCICCKSTFSKIWNVTRHLCKVHHKSTHQVNKLREIIQKKAFKKPLKDCKKAKIVKIKQEAAAHLEPSSKLSRQQQLIQENQVFMENVDGISKTQLCVACGTKFERQAALISHLQRCPKQLRKLKLQTAAAGDVDTTIKQTADAETVKNPARVSAATTAETDDDYDEDDQRVSLMLSDVPPIASHISFAAKVIDTVPLEPEEVLQQVTNDRGRSEKMQIVNPYRCGSERESSTEKKIKIEVRKDYVKSVGSSTKNTLSTALADDICEVASPMSAMCYRGENSDSDDGGKGSMGGSEGQCNRMEVLELDVGFIDKDHKTINSHTDDHEPEGAHKSFMFSKEMVLGSPKMMSILKKSAESNSAPSIGVDDSSSTPQGVVSMKPGVNLTTIFSGKKEAFSPQMQKKMESLINANKLQCLTCRKKFKKMTNLRRHVALHIDWYRYRCTVCFFRCFAKYDCVAHVIKAHLKGGDRVQASSLVELLQNQEPDTLTANGSQRLVEIGETVRQEKTVISRIGVEVVAGDSEMMEDDSDCQAKHLQTDCDAENVPRESGMKNYSTSCISSRPKETSSYFLESPNDDVDKGEMKKTIITEELNLKCKETVEVSSSVDANCDGQKSQAAPNDIQMNNNLSVVFDENVSEKENSHFGNSCQKSVDSKLCTSTSCCRVSNLQIDKVLSMGKAFADTAEQAIGPKTIEYSNVSHIYCTSEAASMPERAAEDNTMLVVDSSMEKIPLLEQSSSIERTTLSVQDSSAEITMSVQESSGDITMPVQDSSGEITLPVQDSSGEKSLPIQDSCLERITLPVHISTEETISLPTQDCSEETITLPASESSKNRTSVSDEASFVDRIILPAQESSVEKVTVPALNCSSERIALPVENCVVERITLPAQDRFVERIVLPTQNRVVEKITLPAQDSFVERIILPTQDHSLERIMLPVQDNSVESITLPGQDDVQKLDLHAHTSTENVISSKDRSVISIDALSKNLNDKKTSVYKINSSLRCSIDKQASLRKVIDKIVSHGKDLNMKNVGSNTDMPETKDISTECGKCDDNSTSSAASQDFNQSVTNCEENVTVPEICVKTEIDSDITIEYEGKRLTTIEKRGGMFIPRRRRGRIGSDSGMVCETDELRSVHIQSYSLPASHFPSNKKRKRANSESSDWGGQSAQSNSSSSHVDAGVQCENDVAKSSNCSVESSPHKDITVQQMVMQVIFGNENGRESSEDFTLNGDVFVPKGDDYCPSAAESGSTASSSPNWALEEPTSNYSGAASPDSDVMYCGTVSQEQVMSVGSGSSRKRLRPIRNRVKVEREDFIYDYGLSDICIMQKEKISEDAKKIAKRKEPVDRSGKESPSKVNIRNAVFPNLLGQDVKLVLPKLTLVRTDDPSVRNEYSVKVGEDSKTSSSTGCSTSGKSGMASRKKTSATS